MRSKCTVIYQKDSTINTLDGEIKDSNTKKDILRVISDDYKAANIENNKLKLLTNNDNEKVAKLIDIIDFVENKVCIFGKDNYATKTSVKIIGDNINETIEYPQYESVSKIIINDCEVNFETDGYNDWNVNIINEGSSKYIFDKFEYTNESPQLIIGFDEEVTNLQMVKNYI